MSPVNTSRLLSGHRRRQALGDGQQVVVVLQRRVQRGVWSPSSSAASMSYMCARCVSQQLLHRVGRQRAVGRGLEEAARVGCVGGQVRRSPGRPRRRHRRERHGVVQQELGVLRPLLVERTRRDRARTPDPTAATRSSVLSASASIQACSCGSSRRAARIISTRVTPCHASWRSSTARNGRPAAHRCGRDRPRRCRPQDHGGRSNTFGTSIDWPEPPSPHDATDAAIMAIDDDRERRAATHHDGPTRRGAGCRSGGDSHVARITTGGGSGAPALQASRAPATSGVPLQQPRDEVVRRHRPADQVALRVRAAAAAELVEDLLLLDAFGDDLEAELLGQARLKPDHRGRGLVGQHRGDERLIDLQDRDRHRCQVADRRVARSEVVDGDRDTQIAQPFQVLGRAPVIAQQRALGQLELERTTPAGRAWPVRPGHDRPARASRPCAPTR